MAQLSSPAPHNRPLAGHLVVFAGKLSSVSRKDAYSLVARLGGDADDELSDRTTLLVVGSDGASPPRARPSAPDVGEISPALRKAEQLNAHGAAIRIVSEDQFCDLAGLPSLETLRQQYYLLRDALGMYPAIHEDHIRYLEKFGLIQPVVRSNTDKYLRFSDLVVIRQASAEIEQGAPFRGVLRSLQASQSGQLTFNFRLDAEPAKIIKLRRPDMASVDAPHAGDRSSFKSVVTSPAGLAEEYFLEGSRLDVGVGEELDAAAAAYRKALEIDPYLVAAIINLGNIHYARDEFAEAEALYERAISLAPEFFEAHFNQGNIYHDLSRYQEAASCYRTALTLNPSYGDAHFYLAVTLEKMGHSHEAKPHWRAYQRIAPEGEWVELAREFSE